ncbi:MAG: hypothetical protein WEA31_01915 [Pirellulales bacterium]
MATKKNGETENRWREILERQAGSQLSIRGFCAAEGISEPSFYAWRKRLATRNSNARRARRNVSPAEEASDNARLFIPLQLLDTAATLEILHPLGYRIQVTGDVNPIALRHVIETLDERASQ